MVLDEGKKVNIIEFLKKISPERRLQLQMSS